MINLEQAQQKVRRVHLSCNTMAQRQTAKRLSVLYSEELRRQTINGDKTVRKDLVKVLVVSIIAATLIFAAGLTGSLVW